MRSAVARRANAARARCSRGGSPRGHGCAGCAALAAAPLHRLGVAIGWFGRAKCWNCRHAVTFQRQAALTHALAADANRPVEVWANEEERLVRWLSALEFPLHAPNLNALGCAGRRRLVAGNGGRAVHGENRIGSASPLCARMASHRGKPRSGTPWKTVSASSTDDEDCGYALSGRLDRGQLLAIARSSTANSPRPRPPDAAPKR
jgi:anti-sigma factor RsiW